MAGIAFPSFPELSVYVILLVDVHVKLLLDGGLPSTVAWDDIVELLPCKRDSNILVKLTIITLNNLPGGTHLNLTLIILLFPEKDVSPLLVDGLDKLFQLRNFNLCVGQAKSLQYKIPYVPGLNKFFVQEDSLHGLAESLRIIGTDEGKTAISTV